MEHKCANAVVDVADGKLLYILYVVIKNIF